MEWAAKTKKKSSLTSCVGDSCFCSQVRSKTNNEDTDFNIDRHEKEQSYFRRANRTSYKAKDARTT